MTSVLRWKRWLVGVDPSMSGTGVVVLRVVVPGPTYDARRPLNKCEVEVLDARTIRPRKGGTPVQRNRDLAAVGVDIRHLMDRHGMYAPWRIVVEDPRDFRASWRGGKGAHGLAVMASAFGAVLAGIQEVVVEPTKVEVHTVLSQGWLPNSTGPVKAQHDKVSAHLVALWPALEPCKDDERFAAGVAMAWLTGQRLDGRSTAGINEAPKQQRRGGGRGQEAGDVPEHVIRARAIAADHRKHGGRGGDG